MESLNRIIGVFQPAVIYIQETKLRQKNKVIIKDYKTFECIRTDFGGGGLMTVVHESLNPVAVTNEEAEELVVVEGMLNTCNVRFINGYGLQESASIDSRKSFYDALDLEIKKAKVAGAQICIEMDSNAKLGQNLIPNDAKPQSDNGRLLENVVVQNELIVVNGTDICEGLITRYRKNVLGIEEAAVIDHLIVSEDFFQVLSKMVIDESGLYTLTKYTNKRGDTVNKKESDHRTIIAELDLKWSPDEKWKKDRVEIYDYKNKESFAKFVELTSNNKELEEAFVSPNIDLEDASRKWLKSINTIIKLSFKKVRVAKSKNSPDLEALFDEKEKLKSQLAFSSNNVDIAEIEEALYLVEDKISEFCAKKNKDIVSNYLSMNNDAIEGYSQANTWALMKKLTPKCNDEPPSAKVNKNGEIVTDFEALKSLYLETYKDRLQPNPISDDLVELKEMKEFLLNLQMNAAKSKTSHDWTISNLDKTLKTLKNNKARDEYQHTYELFKYGGHSLKLSLLRFFNTVKTKQEYPSILQISNITSIWKRKGKKSDLENERGIFNVPKIRSILDKMIYNDIYETIDTNMSSSNIGARKNRNIRDHIFVIHAIINDVLNNKQSEDIDIQICDVAKCFDKLEFTNTAIDLFKAGVQDDKFIAITSSNNHCDVAVKTPMGITPRTRLDKIEMQGTVLAGLKCSITIDTIGKEALESTENILFKYKNCVSIPPLSLIDDILAVTECSPKTIQQCSTINAKLQSKQLRLHPEKCCRMHISRKKRSIKMLRNCPRLHENVSERKISR